MPGQFDVLRPGDMVRKIMTRINGDTRVADTMQHQCRYADRRQNMRALHSDDRGGGRWTGALRFKARESTPKGFRRPRCEHKSPERNIRRCPRPGSSIFLAESVDG
jgi:hypothetical protein